MDVLVAIPILEDIVARLTVLEEAYKNRLPEQKFYTVKECAAYLNVSERQVFRYMKRGLLKRTGVDHKNQIAAESLKNFPNAS